MATPTALEVADELDASLSAVVGRLHRQFPDLPHELVTETVLREAAGFRSARVHAYVPILVERQARDLLAALTVAR